LAIALGYLALLFLLAGWVERQRDRFARPRYRRPAYVLALAVYCTSWTFFGAVGSAAADGWSFLPITLGPILVWLLVPWLVPRLIESVQRDGASSISDFIGGRFGKSRGVAALVTLLALVGTIPYLALQLRSVGTTFVEIAGGDRLVPVTATACVLAAFAMLFGTRRYSISGRSEAVLYAVAVESLVKLAALLAVAGFAVMRFSGASPALQADGLAQLSTRFDPGQLGGDFIVITLLAMAAIVCLPRQFYIGVTEAAGPADARAARWPFITYLLATTMAVVPITLAGLTLLPATSAPDLFVLDLPLAAGADGLVLLVFLGGFSAATGMAVVETIALSTMVSNDLVGPLLLPRLAGESDVGRVMLAVRRLAIIAVMGAALAYALALPPGARLADIGLIAFAAMAQFAPALAMALRDRTGDARAAMAGLGTGLLLWALLLLLPTLGLPAWEGLGDMGLTRGVLISLGGNIAAYALVAARRLRTVPADTFAGEAAARLVTIGALADMAARFAGAGAVAEALGPDRNRNDAVERRDARAVERLIAGVVGGPSARTIMASALSGTALRVDDVARMLDETGQSLQFSRGLLAATLENIDPGVSVVDRDLRLVAWNSRYLELFRYPAGMVKVGTSVADLIRYNALRGECGPGEVDDHVARRLGNMRRAAPHSFERVRPDGRVIKTVGGPMAGGGYVMCFTDITAEAEARAALEKSRAELESRVIERTGQLQAVNAALGKATAEKTRFLAAASHDLLQPLHAARLFAGALADDVPASARPLLENVDRSIAAADKLLRALLDISKLDAGGITPRPTRFSARALLAELVESFMPLAAEKGLRLRLGRGDAWVETDRDLLRSVVQNFVSNAVRYTDRGGIIVGVRRRAGAVRIEVRDSGFGIAAADQARIFREFERLGHGSEVGLGLGLAIAQRTAALLAAPIDLWSVPGRGSRFAVTLVAAAAGDDVAVPAAPGRPAAPAPGALAGMRVLVVDDDAAIRDGSAALLATWGCLATVTATPDEALAAVAEADAALVDLDLGADGDGIDLIRRLRARNPGLACALVTADRSVDTITRCAAEGIALLAKPIEPALLAQWLAVAAPRAVAAQ
jgi:Na+/proline symporter/signal transduction histidine kinase/CheY-like chemotaxis protein